MQSSRAFRRGPVAKKLWTTYTDSVLSVIDRWSVLPTDLRLPTFGPCSRPMPPPADGTRMTGVGDVAPTLSSVFVFTLDSSGSLTDARVAASALSGIGGYEHAGGTRARGSGARVPEVSLTVRAAVTPCGSTCSSRPSSQRLALRLPSWDAWRCRSGRSCVRRIRWRTPLAQWPSATTPTAWRSKWWSTLTGAPSAARCACSQDRHGPIAIRRIAGTGGVSLSDSINCGSSRPRSAAAKSRNY